MFAADWAPVITIPLIATAASKNFRDCRIVQAPATLPVLHSGARQLLGSLRAVHTPELPSRRKGIISSKMALIRNERFARERLTASTTRPTPSDNPGIKNQVRVCDLQGSIFLWLCTVTRKVS